LPVAEIAFSFFSLPLAGRVGVGVRENTAHLI